VKANRNFPDKPTPLDGTSQPASDILSQSKHHTTLPPARADASDDKNLWDNAYAKLHKEKREVVETYERILANTAAVQKGLPLRETMRVVIDNRVEVMTNRQWRIRILWRNEPLVIRELVDKIVYVILSSKT
jgi:hypothetical protein